MFGARKPTPPEPVVAGPHRAPTVPPVIWPEAEAVARSLRQLDALKAAGVVDDLEHAEQRARILARL